MHVDPPPLLLLPNSRLLKHSGGRNASLRIIALAKPRIGNDRCRVSDEPGRWGYHSLVWGGPFTPREVEIEPAALEGELM